MSLEFWNNQLNWSQNISCKAVFGLILNTSLFSHINKKGLQQHNFPNKAYFWGF